MALTSYLICLLVVAFGFADAIMNERIAKERDLFNRLELNLNTDVVPFASLTQGVYLNLTLMPFTLKGLEMMAGHHGLKPPKGFNKGQHRSSFTGEYSTDTDAEYCEMYAWLMMDWVDPQLYWNPSEYAGIKRVNIARKKVWVPDMVLNNGVGPEAVDFYRNSNEPVIVQSNGASQLVTPITLKAHIGKTDPAQIAPCVFDIGSWSYDRSRIDLTNLGTDMMFFKPNSKWTLAANSVSKSHYNIADMHFGTALYKFDFKHTK